MRISDWSSDVCSSDLVGGATYQVPVEVRPDRAQALAISWLITAARNRSETTMAARLSGELLDASNNRGNAVKKREDTHRKARTEGRLVGKEGVGTCKYRGTRRSKKKKQHKEKQH